ncbi:endonuclease/exonuclease/phosphatase family protein [Nocardioides aquiterrae]|uniref:Endonuclease/exonuclease/phosphatase domain-containing protein n=1 Tax=Nocardioides aquiterrae TaxID=203799 RepID=A0ABN1UAA0_9ACTN
MTKHVGPPDPAETTGAAVATIAVVGVLGVVIAVLAIFRPGGAPDPEPNRTAADVAIVTPSSPSEPAQSVRAGRRVTAAPTVEPQEVGTVGKELRKKTQKVVAQEPTTFRVATFNVLGASHTKPGGNKKGWAPAGTRMAWATSIVTSYDADVIGFQEFESSQVSTFLARTGGRWSVYPGNAGDPRNSIAWRTDTWELVQGATVPIPYFRGRTVDMPYVRLHNLASGQDVYFINVHNPASTGRWGDNERWRDAATAREIELINQLHAENFPVVLTGDFNERDEIFCKVTGSGAMVSASGGVASGGTCLPPPGMGVDWIFGSSVIRFSDYLSQRTGLVQRATDHPFVVSTATIPPLGAR